jgi:hypothetical protein
VLALHGKSGDQYYQVAFPDTRTLILDELHSDSAQGKVTLSEVDVGPDLHLIPQITLVLP